MRFGWQEFSCRSLSGDGTPHETTTLHVRLSAATIGYLFALSQGDQTQVQRTSAWSHPAHRIVQ
jgi:hypothetical protein